MYDRLTRDFVANTAAPASAAISDDLPDVFMSTIGWGHDYIPADQEGLPTRYDEATGSYFLDAEKSWDDDEALCWAATVSNQLVWTGWAAHAETEEDFSTEDALLAYMHQVWGNVSYNTTGGIRWFLNNQHNNGSTLTGGGFFPEVDGAGYYFNDGVSVNTISPWNMTSQSEEAFENYKIELKALLLAGYSVSLSVRFTGGGSHAIGLWGYEETDDGKFYIYYTNSDDTGYHTVQDPTQVDNVLNRCELTYNASTKQISVYRSDVLLDSFRALASYDSVYAGGSEDMTDARLIDTDTRIRYGKLDDDGNQAQDVDYYRIDIASDALIAVDVDTFSDLAGKGGFQVAIYDADGNLLAESGPTALHQTILAPAVGGESLYIRVSGAPGLSGTALSRIVANVYTVSYGTLDWELENDRLTLSTELPTNQDVVATIDFGAATARRYSLNGRDWYDYTDAGIVIGANTRIYLYGDGPDGQEAFYCQVENIDKTPPEKPTAMADITELTNGDVMVTATFPDDAAVREYSVDGGTNWLIYTAPVVLTENITVLFRATDGVGNVSEITELVIDNIDKVAPDAPVAVADITAPTNGSVTVTTTFTADTVLGEYSLDGGNNWLAYTAPLVIADNQTILFRATDGVGNVSEITELVIDNIDKIAPERPVPMADVTIPTNQPVLVTAVFPEDAFRKEYSLNGWIWHTYTAGVEMGKNGTVYFRCFDEAGNRSAMVGYTVDNIDLVGPDAPEIFASVITDTSYSVKLSALFADDAVRSEYSLNGQDWTMYTGPVSISANGVVYFRSFDVAGNASLLASYTVSNIDETVKNGLVGVYSRYDRQDLEVALPGRYTLSDIEFGNLNARIAIVDENGRKMASGKVKNGVLTFKEVLLDTGSYSLVVENTDKGASAGYYATRLEATEYFSLADQQLDDNWATAPTLDMAQGGGIASEWAGFGDAVDYRKLDLSSSGTVDFALTGNSSSLKLTVYEVSGDRLKKVKSVTVKAGSSQGLAGLTLDDAKEYVLSVEAPKAAKGVNSAYSLAISGTWFDNQYNALDNNQWQDAELLDLESGIAGEYVGLGDARDWFRFELAGAGTLDLALQPEVAKAARMTLYVYDETRQGLRKLRSGSDWNDLDLAAGQYFVEIVSADQGKGKKNTEYGIAVDFEPAIEQRICGGALA